MPDEKHLIDEAVDDTHRVDEADPAGKAEPKDADEPDFFDGNEFNPWPGRRAAPKAAHESIDAGIVNTIQSLRSGAPVKGRPCVKREGNILLCVIRYGTAILPLGGAANPAFPATSVEDAIQKYEQARRSLRAGRFDEMIKTIDQRRKRKK